MGVDFIRARAKTFKKSWDSHKLELSRRTLFTKDPTCLERGAVARLVDGIALGPQERVLVRVEGDELVAVHEMTVRAVFINPPGSLIDLIRRTGGYADGRVEPVGGNPDLVEVLIC